MGKTIRRCTGCGRFFSQKASFRNPYEYCAVCREKFNGKESIEYQAVMKGLPKGKYIVMQCSFVGMIGNEFNKTILARSAMDGFLPEGMIVFNVSTREVYKIVGRELRSQRIVPLEEIPETVSRRIESSYPRKVS